MNKRLKSNSGFALVGTLVIISVLSLMGTVMFAYSSMSLRSVRFMSDRKKAEYMAQAGVEAVSYAYKCAVDNDNKSADVLSFLSAANADGAEIKSNTIYLIWDGTNKEYKFVKETDSEYVSATSDSTSKIKIIGSYVVTIKSEEKTTDATFLNDTTTGVTPYQVTLKDYIKTFTCVGEAYGSGQKCVREGYFSEPRMGLGAFYDATTGIIDGSATGSNAANSNFVVLGRYQTETKLTWKTKLIGNVEIPINGGAGRSVPIVMGFGSGNVVIDEPASGAISFKKNQDNIVNFVAIDDLFVRSDIDVTSSNSYFNVLTLKGNNIVVNGDITLSAYGLSSKSSAGIIDAITKVGGALVGNYRLGTVVVGTPSAETAKVTDPVTWGRCGRIYFGGNVFVNIQMPNVGTYRYKAFSAGDVYYFNDNKIGDSSQDLGVDLLKYFLDKSIYTNKYSKDVIRRFTELRDLYYNGADPYVYEDHGKTIDYMRKIDVDQYSADSYVDLVPPDPTDGSNLKWGRPDTTPQS